MKHCLCDTTAEDVCESYAVSLLSRKLSILSAYSGNECMKSLPAMTTLGDNRKRECLQRIERRVLDKVRSRDEGARRRNMLN